MRYFLIAVDDTDVLFGNKCMELSGKELVCLCSSDMITELYGDESDNILSKAQHKIVDFCLKVENPTVSFSRRKHNEPKR